jgi:hypothetical protein
MKDSPPLRRAADPPAAAGVKSGTPPHCQPKQAEETKETAAPDPNAFMMGEDQGSLPDSGHQESRRGAFKMLLAGKTATKTW